MPYADHFATNREFEGGFSGFSQLRHSTLLTVSRLPTNFVPCTARLQNRLYFIYLAYAGVLDF